MKTSFPLVNDISFIPLICVILQKSSAPLPLKNIANRVTAKEIDKPLLIELFKSYKINPDMLTLMTDLKIIIDLKVDCFENSLKFPGININLLEYCGDPSRIKFQFLSDLGKEIAYSEEKKEYLRVKNLVFLGFLISIHLPRFFKDVIQDKSLVDKEIEIAELRQQTSMKQPDAKNLVEWLKWMNINLSTNNKLILDGYEILYKIIYAIVASLNYKYSAEIENKKLIYFYQIRSKLNKLLGLNETFVPFDKLFKLIYNINKDKITFTSARDGLLDGRGFEGKTKASIILISDKLDYPTKEECVEYTDLNALLVV
ncbi:hypothetical protein BRM9_1168 [Methanobacterium formicicum]|uniref:Uncharacterized protein n=1 Tax=Methanobacterium formicicum TaxID=2162 RepID=A0A089ZV83_METFO|nr:hypothetical protein [Methanobacterium formicicum]AIS31984.1 hypothetical protein BRM9_1168 [Methanobacterium formicicum]